MNWKIINYPICFIKGLFMTLDAFNGAWFSGHDYYEQEDGSLLCAICGKVSK